MTVAVVLLKATAILATALLGVRLARRSRAAVRHAILTAAFVAVAGLPLAVATLPVAEFAVLPRDANREAAAAGAVSPSSRESAPGTAASDGVETPGRTGPDARSITNRAGLELTFVLLVLWFAGASVVLLSLAAGLYRVQRLRRMALPCIETERHLPALAGAAGVGKAVEIVMHEELSAPITCGLLRPAIVLPPDAHGWPDAALTRALVHELEHVRRHDWAVQIIARAVCALYWFHPLAWIAYRQLCLQAEHACDDAVVTRGEDTVYADQLVTLARRMSARPVVAVLGMANRSDLAARVTAVLDPSTARGRLGPMRASAVAAVALALLVTLAPLRLVAGAASLPPAVSTDATATPEPQRRDRSTRLDRMLVEAADDGDLPDVRDLLDDGADVDAAIAGDGSPLIAAARNNHIDIVRLLLDRGADVNLAVEGDGAPLIMAAREGHLAIVELLLDRGADIERMTKGDENALIQASGSGQLEMVKLLVARGASVNARTWAERVFNRPDGEWRTPLSMALRGGHRDVAAFLRANGAVE